MRLNLLYISLLGTSILFLGCHVYYTGIVINNTRDTISITTKPSLLVYERDKHYEKLVQLNTGENHTTFSCFIPPNDSLIFNSGPSYSSTLSVIEYLKINKASKDSLIFISRKTIREHVKVFKRKFNKVTIGIVVTDSIFNVPGK